MKVQKTVITFSIMIFTFFITGFANNVNNSSQKGLVRLISPQTHGATLFNFGAAGMYARDASYVTGLYGSGPVTTSTGSSVSTTYPELISTNVYTTFGITNIWDIGISIPFYMDRTGWNDEKITGIGDLEISNKMTYPFQTD